MTLRDLIKIMSFNTHVLVLDDIGAIKADGLAIDLAGKDELCRRNVAVVGVSESILIIQTSKEKAK